MKTDYRIRITKGGIQESHIITKDHWGTSNEEEFNDNVKLYINNLVRETEVQYLDKLKITVERI